MSKEQLLSRLQQLNARHEELTESNAPYESWTRLSEDEIRYAIPEYFERIADISKAIDAVISDLYRLFSIEVTEIKGNYFASDAKEEPANQLSLFGPIPFPSSPDPLRAA